MKRLLVVLLSAVLLLGLLPFAPVAAAEKETIIVAGSDFQVSGNSATKLFQLLNTLEVHGITKADAAFFCGDYTPNAMETNTSQYGMQVLKDTFQPLVGNKMIFVQGNHDHENTPGLAPSGANDPANRAYGAFVIREDQYREWGNKREDTEAVVSDLRVYLQKKYDEGWNVPIFVLCHIPLHWSNRTQRDGSGTDADLIFDALNDYAAKGMNIFYLYGHNHSGGYDDFMGGAAVYLKKGDTMEVCHGNKWEHKTRTLKFTYMNAGFIGYYSTDEEETDAALTISVFRIKGNEVIVTRYDTDINLSAGRNGVHNLKSKGVFNKSFYEKYNFHAEVDTKVYGSSRKVTATSDVQVKPPAPPATTTTTTTTTAVKDNSAQHVTKNTQATTGATTGKTQGNGTTRPSATQADETETTTPSQKPEKGDTETTTQGQEDTQPTDSTGAPEDAETPEDAEAAESASSQFCLVGLFVSLFELAKAAFQWLVGLFSGN